MTSQNINLSVVVPYFNEEKNIVRTLNNLNKQTFKNFEVILINSNSTDNSSKIVDEWISKNNSKIKYKNYNKNTFFPSDSKNVGIKCSSSKWIAFMDVDLKFSKFWLETQVDYLIKKKSSYVMGLCHFKGFGFFDKCFVAQTWGYNSKIPVVPSSIFHKSLFKKFGFFQNSRAGYDKVWKKNLKIHFNSLNVNCSKNSTICYNKYNHSDSFVNFIKKIFNYANSSFKVKNNHQPKIYLSLITVFLLLLFLNLKIGLTIFLFYAILRSYIYPLIKSNNIKLNKIKISYILFLPIVGIGIDLTRLIAYFSAILKIK